MAEAIPAFRPDGYLPEGIHKCTEADAIRRFGSQNRRRRRLVLRLRDWITLGRTVHAARLLVDGSFVTAKADPDDVDAVMLLPSDFARQLDQGIEAALELEEMFLTRQPEEIFAARKMKMTFRRGLSSLATQGKRMAAVRAYWRSFYDFECTGIPESAGRTASSGRLAGASAA